ncbi:uncharacterized protein LOC114749688 [Neltuma alba]|uniref:uncharacterized protein LOC114749688 n=1 Tax=Neltuma alba TaxID=207710 RepID=UPI0010A4B75F|nr:uncharacterized protein LOC114749688 [Prosopis alba]
MTCEEIAELKQRLAAEFEIKDLGNLRYFLGLEIARSPKGISVSQRKYTMDLLKETGLLGARPAETPMELNYKLEITTRWEGYQQGALPKIGGQTHITYPYQTGYLLCSRGCESIYSKPQKSTHGSHIPNPQTSTTGYCTFVWGNLVTWRSKKQPVVSRSSAEAEYRALALGICEGMCGLYGYCRNLG